MIDNGGKYETRKASTLQSQAQRFNQMNQRKNTCGNTSQLRSELGMQSRFQCPDDRTGEVKSDSVKRPKKTHSDLKLPGISAAVYSSLLSECPPKRVPDMSPASPPPPPSAGRSGSAHWSRAAPPPPAATPARHSRPCHNLDCFTQQCETPSTFVTQSGV